MSLAITVTNFRGCAHARLDCAPIALLAGANAAGKSSVAQAVAAVLSANPLPVPGLRANNAGVLVRSGAAIGSVQITSEGGACRLDWPESRVLTTGNAPAASEFATGLQSIVPPMAPKDRLGIIGEYLHADPTREDLEAALNEAGLDGARAIETLWPSIEGDGWDATVQRRRERGQQMKGQWRQVTGANWGSRVGASWRPDLADLDHGELERAVANAKNDRDRAVSAAAVSADEKRRLEEEADLADARQGALTRATARVDEYTTAFHAAQEARAKLPPADRASSVPCPKCGAALLIQRVSLVETRIEAAPDVDIDNAELRRRREAIAQADGKLSHADGDLQQARREQAMAETAVRDSLNARDRLASWPKAVETGLTLESAAARLAEAEQRLAEYATKIEADRLHSLIEGNEIVIDLLSSDGLRASKLANRIGAFNANIGKLAEIAQWTAPRLDEAGGVSYSDRPYGLLSSSEQYRVRTVLAVAMAQIDGSNLIICDGADILDAPARGGLFSLLAEVGIPALVCMTLRREHVPDLAASELGASYWLAGGTTELLGEKVAA